MTKCIKIGVLSALVGVVAIFGVYYFASLTAGKPDFVEYQVTSSDEIIEVRQYPVILTAQIQINGTREQSLEEGSKSLEAFYNGENNFLKKLEMYSPYFQQQDSRQEDMWTISTPLPEELAAEGAEIPKPNDERIKFVKVPAQSYAAISFSGAHSDANLEEHYQTLVKQLQKNKVIPKSNPLYSFYSPNWALPMARTIEVMTFVPSDLKLNQE